MTSKFFFFIFIIAFFSEIVLTSIPLVLIMLLNLFIFSKKEWIFILAFITGILFDIIFLRAIGYTSMFFVSALFLVSLYEQKFETSTAYFIFIMSFVLSAIYLILFNRFLLIESVFSAIIGVFMFLLFNFLKYKEISSSTKTKKYDINKYYKKA
jgi:cell shape-determining protein MreD